MRKILYLLFGIFLLTGCGQFNTDDAAQTVNDDINFFSQITKETRERVQEKKDLMGFKEEDKTAVYKEINDIKIQSKQELEYMDKKIASKELQIKNTKLSKELNESQRQSRIVLYEKELKSLKEEKVNIEAKWKNKMIDTRGF